MPADPLSEYEALRDRLRKYVTALHREAADALDALLRRLELESQTLRDTMASYERLDQEHEALEAQVRALTRERDEAREQLRKLDGLPESDKKTIADFAAFLGMPEADLPTMTALTVERDEARAELARLTRERESDYAQALAHRKGLTAKLDMAEAELARLRAAVEFACKQRCGPFLDYGRHAPECLAYELLPDEQARSAEQPGGGT